MKIYIVGIGMDGEKTLTAEAKNAIIAGIVMNVKTFLMFFLMVCLLLLETAGYCGILLQ